MKLSKILFLIILFFCCNNLFYAQSTCRIAYINLSVVMETLPQTDSIRTILTNEITEANNIIEGMQVEINILKDSLERQLSYISDNQKNTIQSDILEFEKKLNNFKTEVSTRIGNRNVELYDYLIGLVQKGVEIVAISEEIDYVFDIDEGKLLFVSEAANNINEEIIGKLQLH